MTQDILDLTANVPADTRPTRAQFLAMPHPHRKALVRPLNAEGQPFTIADVSAVRAARAERRKQKKARKPVRVNGKNHTQKSEGIRRDS